VEAKALIDTLNETLPVTVAVTFGYIMGDVETFELVDTLAHTLAEAEANTIKNALLGVEAGYKLAITLLDSERDTLGDK